MLFTLIYIFHIFTRPPRALSSEPGLSFDPPVVIWPVQSTYRILLFLSENIDTTLETGKSLFPRPPQRTSPPPLLLFFKSRRSGGRGDHLNDGRESEGKQLYE